MIRRLRWKMVSITSVLLTLVLALILGLITYATWHGLQRDSAERMEAVQQKIEKLNRRPGQLEAIDTEGCIVIWLERDGSMVAIGPEHYLTSRQDMMNLIQSATKQGRSSGVLEDWQFRYLRVGNGQQYVFADIRLESHMMRRLVTVCVLILLLGTVVFFFISLWIARWAIHPVERAWEQQRQFVADASHELKTPLTVILTNAELLKDPSYDASGKERFADSILTMSRQMRGLVEDLLDQARVDNGAAMDRKLLDWSKVVLEAVLPFEPVYFEAGKTLETEIQPEIHVLGSEDHLRRVVEILLDNGCKYSSPGGTVLLRLVRERKGCLLSVTSPGEALTEQQLEDIFKRFYRGDAARKMDHSYGLGLSIAQGIIRQHKGEIWAQSEEGWNTFFVRLGCE